MRRVTFCTWAAALCAAATLSSCHHSKRSSSSSFGAATEWQREVDPPTQQARVARVEVGYSAPRLQMYDVRSFVFPRTEFTAPRIGALPSGDDEPRTGGEGEERVHTISPDDFVELVKMATGPNYWATDASATIELLDTGMLIVRATPAVHRAVREFIGG